MNSFVSATEDNSVISPKNYMVLSSSPDVFKDFYSIIDQEEDEDYIRLKYKIVMKDIIIKHLQKELKKYEYGHHMWFSLVNSI
jgi:hypothetical protein